MCDEMTQNCTMVFRNWEDPLLRYKDKLKQNLNSIIYPPFEEVASELSSKGVCSYKALHLLRGQAKQSTEHHFKVTAASTTDAVPRPV